MISCLNMINTDNGNPDICLDISLPLNLFLRELLTSYRVCITQTLPSRKKNVIIQHLKKKKHSLIKISLLPKKNLHKGIQQWRMRSCLRWLSCLKPRAPCTVGACYLTTRNRKFDWCVPWGKKLTTSTIRGKDRQIKDKYLKITNIRINIW